MHKWERRLKDLAHLLTNCGTTYYDPDLFRLNTNQFLQTSRTVTFIIQKNKASIPDFDTWYQRNVLTPWAGDSLMSWARDSRNVIEKEGDLELHSSIRLTLLFSYLSPDDVVLPDTRNELLFDNVTRLLRLARAKLPTTVADDAALKLERRWVANSLPDKELVYALTYIYSRLYEVCSSLARQLGSEINRQVPEPTELDPASNDVAHVRYIKLSSLNIGRLANIRMKADPNFKPPSALVMLREELRGTAKPNSLRETVEYFGRFAKFTFEFHGNHRPMLFLFDDHWEQIDFLTTDFADQADKYIFWRTVAERAAYLRAYGLVWVSESWIRNAKEMDSVAIRNLTILGERLHVVGADVTNARHVVAWNIRRPDPTAGPVLESVPDDDPLETGGSWYFLVPILEAMREARPEAKTSG